jgi:hypothetical protein
MLTTIGIFAAGVFTAALSRLLVEEMGEWNPWIVRGIVKLSVARLPENQRERFREEWESHVNEVPGKIGKLLCAAGFLVAAQKIASIGKRSVVQHRGEVFTSTYGLLAPVDGREVVRCDHCLLVQFRTTNELCRRCHARF